MGYPLFLLITAFQRLVMLSNRLRWCSGNTMWTCKLGWYLRLAFFDSKAFVWQQSCLCDVINILWDWGLGILLRLKILFTHGLPSTMLPPISIDDRMHYHLGTFSFFPANRFLALARIGFQHGCIPSGIHHSLAHVQPSHIIWRHPTPNHHVSGEVFMRFSSLIILLVTLKQGSATYGTRATLGTPSNFQWHTGAPSFTYHFCYESHRRYIDLDLYKKTYVVGALNDLKPCVGTHLAKGCRPLV